MHASARHPIADARDETVGLDVRYAKRGREDILIRVTATNRGADVCEATIEAALSLPHEDGGPDGGSELAPATIRAPWETLSPDIADGTTVLCVTHPSGGPWWLAAAEGAERHGPATDGTEATLRYRLRLQAGERRTLRLRLSRSAEPRSPWGADVEAAMGTRAREAAAFGASLLPGDTTPDEVATTSRALASLLWTPPFTNGGHVDDVVAAVALALADPVAGQLRSLELLAARPGHPVGRLEPPLGAWAALRIAELGEAATGGSVHGYLERSFLLLLEDFSGWVDRLDGNDRNPIQGGLIGLDGIDGSIEGTAWMSASSLWMFSMAVELARVDATYQDVAVTFLDTSLALIAALDDLGGSGIGMWDEDDGRYHDVARDPDGTVVRLPDGDRVGLLPLLGVALIPRAALARLPEVSVRCNWAMRHRTEIAGSILRDPRRHGSAGDALITVVPTDRRLRVMAALEAGSGATPPAMTLLLIDALDRILAFETRGRTHARPDERDERRRLAVIRRDMAARLYADPSIPPWATLLAGAMRLAR